MKTFSCTLSRFDNPLYEGSVSKVSLPALDGVLVILPRHAPLLTFLCPGLVVLTLADHVQKFWVSSGFADMGKAGLKILVRDGKPFDEDPRFPQDFQKESLFFEDSNGYF